MFARSTTSPGSCGTTLAVGASCTYNVVFSPVAITGYSRTLTVAATGATITPSSVTLTGTGVAAPSRPTLGVLDNFNRANSSGSLGANWGATALSVNDVTLLTPSTGTAMCVTASLCGLLGGQANWNAAFGANQAAAFTFANSTVGASSLNLKASGTALLGVSPNYIRVMNTGTTVVVQTTTNFGLAFTTQATLSTGSTSASGNVLTALVDPAGVVYVWRTVGATTSYIGGVALPTDPLWTGGGQIGIRMTSGARVDDFAGGTVP